VSPLPFVVPVPAAWAVLALTALTLALLLPFAFHRLHLLRVAARGPGAATGEEAWMGPLPRVTVQLPIYNEAGVVERLLEAAARLDYPRELLEIQLLDDSTDGTSRQAARVVAALRAEGVPVEHLRRGGGRGSRRGLSSGGWNGLRGSSS
jgi:cellulose synthase/poly-beta-1,6-N-acetylglucosamine synthase-like glycosyltransferase